VCHVRSRRREFGARIRLKTKALLTAYRLQDPGLPDIKVDPLVDPIGDEPRFRQIVERLDFPM
jgi:hypothetical protein